MVEQSLTDRSRAEALFRKNRDFRFLEVMSDYGPYIFCAVVLGVGIDIQIRNYQPFDLPLIAQNIILLILVVGMSICSVFLLRKLRSRHDRELITIYEELFFEGIEEELVRHLVGHSFLYLQLPTRPSENKKRRRLKAKREGRSYEDDIFRST